MGIGEYVSESFAYANEGLFGKWLRWIILIISSIIFPLIMGYTLRVMKGITPAPETDNYVGMFIDGIKMFIIDIVYMIIPVIIGLLVLVLTGGMGSLAMLGMNVENPAAYGGMLIASFGLAMIVFIIFAFIFSLFAIIGMIRFARNGRMGAAFEFSEISATIGKIGWGQYIIALIVLFIIIFVISFILGMIPVIGWILSLIISPYIAILSARYYSLLYDAGV